MTAATSAQAASARTASAQAAPVVDPGDEVRSAAEALWTCRDPFLIGVRHHSPALAAAMPALLEAAAPDRLLVELPMELAPWLGWLAHPDTQAPVALSAVREDGGGLSFYPFADFSPELAAIRWAVRKGIPVEPCDLPWASSAWRGAGEGEPAGPVAATDGEAGGGGDEAASEPDAALPSAPAVEGRELAGSMHRAAGVGDPEELWDRLVEVRAAGSDPERVRRAALALGWALRRSASVVGPVDLAREAWMRERIRAAHGRLAVVVGAFHAPALLPDVVGRAAPHVGATASTVVTSLIPYTFPLLDSRSGYPAGIRDPEWQQAAYESGLDAATVRQRAGELAVGIVAAMREAGHAAGTVDATELVRLASRSGPVARPRGAGSPRARRGVRGRAQPGGARGAWSSRRAGDAAGPHRRAPRTPGAGNTTLGSRAARGAAPRRASIAGTRRSADGAAAGSAPLRSRPAAARRAPAARRVRCRVRRAHGVERPRRRDAHPGVERRLAARDGGARRSCRDPRRDARAGRRGRAPVQARARPERRGRDRSRARAGRRPGGGGVRPDPAHRGADPRAPGLVRARRRPGGADRRTRRARADRAGACAGLPAAGCAACRAPRGHRAGAAGGGGATPGGGARLGAPGGCRSAGRARPAGRRRRIGRGQPHRLGAWDHRAGGVAADAGGRRGRARPDRADHGRRVRAIARLVARCRGRPGGSRGAVGPVPGHGRRGGAVRRERRRDPRRALRPRRRADRWRVRRPAARAPRRVRRAVDRRPPAVPPGGDHAARSRRRGRSDARGGSDRDRPVGRCRCRRARRAGRRGLRRRGRVLRRGR